ncbi:multidrug efflux pump subunit AcrA (membrane-fusion protein) [Azomonas agilis]|uniref:Multidrug efflux pump subunit AcrA (Membrane-fusion protein) n=1 Tax=Azomonas agilis TaxID=116849 RepID=A0A562I0W2_9GAMM|nr:efflux RND transporter periplasmic adaptor subunit [Azomonas agilis]TWH64592.1 multidrug efflux pump subunit AcrA (membrane-fusion protein) [Azomonas agilis]
MKSIPFLTTLLCSALVFTQPTQAGPGHDHGDSAPVANSNGPQRLPDGSLFVPKATQHQLGVRTFPVQQAELAQTLELNGTVVMDPSAGGKVQALLAGRIEASAKGLPSLGQRVKQGEVLAFIVASTGALERASQQAQIAALQADSALAEKNLARLRELSDSVPRKEIDAANANLNSIRAQITALKAGTQAREALIAPISGVIAASNVVAGQVVDVRDPIFEILDPTRLRIEALAYDPAQVQGIQGGYLALGEQQVPLNLVGSAHSLREQALPLLFRGEGTQQLTQLALGQKVQVFVQTARRISGFALPAAALMKNASNQSILWVKTNPERFEPRLVTFEVLDGVQIAVTSGLATGDRVVAQAAILINQIR